MYIYFYKDKGDKWSMLPVIILTTLIVINIEVISFFFVKINNFYIVGIFILLIIYLDFLFRNTPFEYVKNYQQSNRKKIIITIAIFIDLILNFIFLNISRNGKFLF